MGQEVVLCSEGQKMGTFTKGWQVGKKEQTAAEPGSQEQTKGIINNTHESECPRSAPLAPSNPSTLRQPL